MPSTVRQVFASFDLKIQGAVRWGTPVPERKPGVYVVALAEQADRVAGTLRRCPLDRRQLDALLGVRPELELDGKRPMAAALARRLSDFWLPDETILYVGLSSRPLRTRVGEYYRTPLGARKPHAGGWWLKTLKPLPRFSVYYAATADYVDAEDELLRYFARNVSDQSRRALRDHERVMPFANLKDADDLIKAHGISGATGELPR